jgi:hypothetical protein
MKAILFAASLVAGAAAQAQAPFDLSCEGARVLNGVSSRPVTVHLRIDPGARLFCRDDCAQVRPIDRVSAERIDFPANAVGSAATAMEARETSYFDRVSGRYHADIEIHYTLGRGSPRSTMNAVEDLACEVAAFSGFPAPAR